jgi:hypothetical protein
MTGVWVAILILVGSSALIFVLALLFVVDLTVHEFRKERDRQAYTAVPVPPARPQLFDQDALEE